MTRCVNRTFLPSMFVRSVGRRCRDGFGFGPSHARQIPRCGAPRRPGLKITILLDGHWLHRPVARTFRNVEWTGDGEGSWAPCSSHAVNSTPGRPENNAQMVSITRRTPTAAPARTSWMQDFTRHARSRSNTGQFCDSFGMSQFTAIDRARQSDGSSFVEPPAYYDGGGFQLGFSLHTFRGRMLRQGPLSDGIACPLPPQTRRRFSRDIARILVPRPILAIGSLAQRVRALRTSMEHRWLGAKVG